MNKNKIAKAIAATALAMAKKACGAASCYGIHQAKEPKEVQEYFAKKKM